MSQPSEREIEVFNVALELRAHERGAYSPYCAVVVQVCADATNENAAIAVVRTIVHMLSLFFIVYVVL
jgi:hypothetical protein